MRSEYTKVFISAPFDSFVDMVSRKFELENFFDDPVQTTSEALRSPFRRKGLQKAI